MKQNEIKIGGIYLVKVGDHWDQVRVVDERRAYPGDVYKHVRYLVARVSDGRTLTKTRAASALHPVPTEEEMARVERKEAIKMLRSVANGANPSPTAESTSTCYRNGWLRATGEGWAAEITPAGRAVLTE